MGWSHLCWRLGCEFWGSLTPGSSHCQALWVQVGIGKQVCCLSPAFHLSFWVLPPPLCPRLDVSVPSLLPTVLGCCEKSTQEGFGGEKRDKKGVKLRLEGLFPLSGVSTAIPCPWQCRRKDSLAVPVPWALAPALPPSADVGSEDALPWHLLLQPEKSRARLLQCLPWRFPACWAVLGRARIGLGFSTLPSSCRAPHLAPCSCSAVLGLFVFSPKHHLCGIWAAIGAALPVLGCPGVLLVPQGPTGTL